MSDFIRLAGFGQIEAPPSDEAILRAQAREPGTFRAVVITENPVMGDVIRAAGVDATSYLSNNPVVLYAHDRNQPVGLCKRMWREGTQWLADFTLAGTEKGKELAILIREGVLRSVSIGGEITKAPQVISDKHGRITGRIIHAMRVEEFSLVTFPADAAAQIQRSSTREFGSTNAATGTPPSSRSRTIFNGHNPMPIGSDIARMKQAHGTALAAAENLYSLASSESRALTPEERGTYDTHIAEAEGLSAQITDAEKLERALLGQAKAVDGHGSPAAPALRTMPTAPPKVEKGIAFARYAMAIARGRGLGLDAIESAKGWRTSTPDVEAVLRAAVAAGNTTDPAWAGPLVPAAQRMGGELIELLFPKTIVGQLNLRRVPFNVEIPRVIGGATANWVGQGKMKPVSKGAFDLVKLGFNKLAVISVLTAELVRFSDPNAEAAVRDLLAASITSAMDSTFVSAAAAVVGVSPAGIANGVTPVASSGATVAAITADMHKILGNYILAGIDISTVASLMSPMTRLVLSGMRTVSDNPAFPEMAGGRFFGTRIVDSNTIPVTAGGGGQPPKSDIIFVSEPNVLLARDDAMRVDVSREAAIEMSSDPEVDAGSMVSLWQTNMIGLLVEQFITWTPARPQAVQLLDNLAVGPVVP